MGRLYRLLDHSQEFIRQVLEVHLVSQPAREAFQGLRGIVLLAIEATIDEGLYATTQRGEQGGYRQRGGHHGELRLLYLAGESTEDRLNPYHAPEVHEQEHQRQRTVDQGAVDDHVDVVESVAEYSGAYGQGIRSNPREPPMVRPDRSNSNDNAPGRVRTGKKTTGNRKLTSNATQAVAPNTTHLVCWRSTGPETHP